jgi:hypothetical protein
MEISSVSDVADSLGGLDVFVDGDSAVERVIVDEVVNVSRVVSVAGVTVITSVAEGVDRKPVEVETLDWDIVDKLE